MTSDELEILFFPGTSLSSTRKGLDLFGDCHGVFMVLMP
jgi:hypothetical protein